MGEDENETKKVAYTETCSVAKLIERLQAIEKRNPGSTVCLSFLSDYPKNYETKKEIVDVLTEKGGLFWTTLFIPNDDQLDCEGEDTLVQIYPGNMMCRS